MKHRIDTTVCCHANTKSVAEGLIIFRCLACGAGKNEFGDWCRPGANHMIQAAIAAAEKAIDVAMKLEREECAKVCEHPDNRLDVAWKVADAIRARGKP